MLVKENQVLLNVGLVLQSQTPNHLTKQFVMLVSVWDYCQKIIQTR